MLKKLHTFLLTVLLYLMSCSSFADSQLLQQREIYYKIEQILSLSHSTESLNLAQQLAEQLRDYPLYPYVKYQLLRATETPLSWQKIQTYQTLSPPTHLVQQLKMHWLAQQSVQGNWQQIIEQQGQLPQNNIAQCIQLEAQLEQTETAQKRTALLAQVEPIWLTGQSLPSQCDSLLQKWISQGQLSADLWQQRVILAFEQHQSALLQHLANYAPNEADKQWLQDLNQLLAKPHLLAQVEQPFYIEKFAQQPFAQQIARTILPKYIKTLPQSAVGFQQVSSVQNGLALLPLSGKEKANIEQLLVSHFFDQPEANIQQWRDEQVRKLQLDSLTERRIRFAIREKQPIATWLALLSPNAQQKEEWRYWLSTTLSKTQRQPILQALAKTRGFYGLLASAELQQDYQPEMRHFNADLALLTAPFALPLQRIAELRQLNDVTNQNLEWQALLAQADFEQKLALSAYAQQQQWFDLAVEATIQAKAWDYLALRLPFAYKHWFDLHLNNKKIHRTFAMAIARQESAWKPYVTSSAQARGLMQLLPSTAKQTAQKFALPYQQESQLFDPFDNIMLGTAHLNELQQRYGDNRILIAAAYNAGAHRVDSWLAKSKGKLNMAEFVASIPFYETRGYVQNVLAYDAYYQLLQQKPVQKFSEAEYNRAY